jgi:hypothetical protein
MSVAFSLHKALMDPKSVFESPENVLADPRLDRRAKLEILKRWEHDARQLAVAEDEAMGGGEPSMLHRVLRAIDVLAEVRPGAGTRASGKM